jgi:hypothetical protein
MSAEPVRRTGGAAYGVSAAGRGDEPEVAAIIKVTVAVGDIGNNCSVSEMISNEFAGYMPVTI